MTEIVAVDHVQFAVRSVARAVAHLGSMRYALRFEARDFNDRERPFFRCARKDMAYVTCGRSRIEVVTGAQRAISGRYCPIFGVSTDATQGGELDAGALAISRNRALSGPCATARGTAAELRHLIVRSSRPAESLSFWQALGFKLTRTAARYDLLAFPVNALSMPLALLVLREPVPHRAGAYVDDYGCASVALITRNLASDLASLGRAGIAYHEPIRLHINGKQLAVSFLSGPGGEIVELIEPLGAHT